MQQRAAPFRCSARAGTRQGSIRQHPYGDPGRTRRLGGRVRVRTPQGRGGTAGETFRLRVTSAPTPVRPGNAGAGPFVSTQRPRGAQIVSVSPVRTGPEREPAPRQAILPDPRRAPALPGRGGGLGTARRGHGGRPRRHAGRGVTCSRTLHSRFGSRPDPWNGPGRSHATRQRDRYATAPGWPCRPRCSRCRPR